MAEPVHQFLGAGPRRRGQCPGDVPEIVKVNLLEPDRSASTCPLRCQTQSRRGPPRAPGKSNASRSDATQRERCASISGITIPGRTTTLRPASVFGGPTRWLPPLVSRRWRRTSTVRWRRSTSATRECEQLASTQPAERGKEHEHAERRLIRVGENVHFRERRERPLVGWLDTRALDRAGIADDQAILDSGREDGAEQSVALGYGGRAGSRCEEPCVPRPDACCGQVTERHGAERRKDVKAEEALVQLLRLRSQRFPTRCQTCVEPVQRVVGESDPAVLGCDPSAASLLRDRRGERDFASVLVL